jgi:predicted O-methyltransferase YrrM
MNSYIYGSTPGLGIHERVKTLLESNWRENDWFYCDSKVILHYAHKAAICARFHPRRVIEIGTRCGYSLLSFNSVAPRASFLCIDGCMDEDSLDCLAHAKHLIERHNIEADLIVVDSHAIRSLPPADFAHVDGDHSYEGALADLRLCVHVRAILADDCCNKEVARAVDQFAREQNRTVEYMHDGLRTVGVIT